MTNNSSDNEDFNVTRRHRWDIGFLIINTVFFASIFLMQQNHTDVEVHDLLECQNLIESIADIASTGKT